MSILKKKKFNQFCKQVYNIDLFGTYFKQIH